MSTLPEMVDAEDAAGLVREIFRNPPRAALNLAVPGDFGPHDAVVRYLLVALRDLPPPQAALLRAGMALLLAEPELALHVVLLLQDGSEESAPVRHASAEAVAGGALRGAAGPGGTDLHAVVLGLAARLGAALPVETLVRDAGDPRYRDLALHLLATARLDAFVPAVVAAAAVDPADEASIEALGIAMGMAIQRHGPDAVLHTLADTAPSRHTAGVLLAALREALAPARLSWLTPAQQEAALAPLRRAFEERGDGYARLRLDAVVRAAFLATAADALGAEL